jgi:PadR family transcriptional regulator, regulatory protein PadR
VEHRSFETIVHELMLEEPTPSYEALVRWQQRYPKYRDSLAEYFADWAMDRELPPPEEEAEIDEDMLVQKGVDYAMDTLRRQDGFIAKTSVEKLKPFDQLVLAAVSLLRGAGDDVNITDKVSEMYGKEVLLAFTFGSLERLERKGLVESRDANPETEPENEGGRYFVVTMAGERALAYARATSRTVDGFLGGLA